MAKKKNSIKIKFCGGNSSEVTGSMIHIVAKDKNILLDAGLIQTNNLKDDYLFNSRKFDFRLNDIDYIFISHLNADHCLLLPRLYKEGCKARIIITKGSTDFLKEMMKDSAYIMSRDIVALNKKSNIKYRPLYDEDDIYTVLEYVEEFDFMTLYELDSEVSFHLYPANHIPKSAQIELIIKQDNHVKKIGYTGDLGNIKIKDKYFIEDFKPIKNVNVLIGECTYSRTNVKVADKRRDKDIEKIITCIKKTCIQDNDKILIPTFALDRTQTMLTVLYEIFQNNKEFKDIPIYVDSPLATTITKLYGKVMEGRDKEILDKIFAWENLRFVKDFDESQALMTKKGKAIICASSGMCDKGRSNFWVRSMVSNPNSCILFVGYAAKGTLASDIRNESKSKFVKINGKNYKNNCQFVNLLSFSAHMQREDLLWYYSEVQCEKIALVHSEMSSKIVFAKNLQEEISRKNKTSKVICINSGSVINL